MAEARSQALQTDNKNDKYKEFNGRESKSEKKRRTKKRTVDDKRGNRLGIETIPKHFMSRICIILSSGWQIAPVVNSLFSLLDQFLLSENNECALFFTEEHRNLVQWIVSLAHPINLLNCLCVFFVCVFDDTFVLHVRSVCLPNCSNVNIETKSRMIKILFPFLFSV